MDKKFLTAFALPEYFDIYGFKLRPLCAKSLLALAAADSPFLTGKSQPTSKDILNFLRICSLDFDGFFKMPEKPSWREMYFYYKMEYWPIFKIRVLLAIKMYMEESTSSPQVRMKNSKVKNENVVIDKQAMPEMLMLLTLLMSKLGFSEKEALEIPIGRAVCYSFAYAAIEGGDMVVVPEEDETNENIRDEIIKHEAEMAKRMKLAMDNGKIQRRKIKTGTT